MKKTAEEWLASEFCERTSPNTGNFTAYGIEAIQADASAASADSSKKIKLGTFGILERSGRFLLGLRSANDTSFPGQWCHPGGGVEYGESIEVALAREFVEEVGLQVKVLRDYVGVFEYFKNGRHVVLHFLEVTSDGTPTAGDGFDMVNWFTLEEIRVLTWHGKTTPLTIVAAEHFGECHRPSGTERQVCCDIADRQKKGIAKYGQTVAENPLNLKEWLQHAYEECLDQAVYLKRAQAELGKAL